MPILIANISPTGTVSVSAFSLKNDTWEDFEFFLAEGANLSRSERSRNRSLRADHYNLYAHFEAVVHELGKITLTSRERKKSLQDRCKLIAEKAQIQPIELLGRESRNEITHPGNNEAKPFEDLNPVNLEVWAKSIATWLDGACEKLKVKRFSDTESLVGELAASLGGHKKPGEV